MQPSQFNFNPHKRAAAGEGFVSDEAAVAAFHRALPGYTPTPLVMLSGLASELGIGRLLLKDEAPRFGLNAFKVLGASYAIFRFLQQAWQQRFGTPPPLQFFFQPEQLRRLGTFTFAAATDGNHGRAVAWTARQLGQQAVIYVPQNMAPARRQAIAEEGARVVPVDSHYDATVRHMAEEAARRGWQIISDTAWPGYEAIPRWIMAGYTTLFAEAWAQMDGAAPDVVLLQGGVGGFAAAGVDFFRRRLGASLPKLVVVEPLDADCLLASSLTSDGEMAHAKGNQNSLMAGLNCGTPSSVAWPLLRDSIDAFIAIDDGWAAQAVRRLYRAAAGDANVVSGESGAAGFAGLLALLGDPALQPARERLGIGAKSRVLLVSTEGATDPDSFHRLVAGQASRKRH